MSFVEELVNKRKFMTSAVSIVETLDPLRLDNITEAKIALGPPTPTADWKFTNRLLWNLQTGIIYNIDREEEDARFGDSLTEPIVVKLTKIMMEEPTLLVIKWVHSKLNTDELSNWLLEWSQHTDIKSNFSTIVVFTTSLTYFPTEVRRWSTCFTVPPSTDGERRAALKELQTKLDTWAKVAAHYPKWTFDMDQLVSATRGMTLHDIRTACQESFHKYKDFRLQVFSQYKTANILAAYRIRYIEPKFNFTAVQGFNYFKNYLHARIIDPLTDPDKYLKEGITPPKGLLMAGPPGVGKTFIAHALAGETGLSVITLNPSDFMASLVGETEARVRQITELIESMSPVIVFIDECDQLLTSRSRLNESTDSGVTTRMVSGLLEWLGSPDRKAFVIGATNYLERIDQAFLRVGRLDKTALLLYPDFESRLHMIAHYSRDKNLNGVNFEALADATAFWNSAELSALPTEAAYVRFSEGAPVIKQEHFEEAMNKAFRIDRQRRKQEMTDLVRSYTTYAPNYEPWLLDEAKKSLGSKDKDLLESLVSTME